MFWLVFGIVIVCLIGYIVERTQEAIYQTRVKWAIREKVMNKLVYGDKADNQRQKAIEMNNAIVKQPRERTSVARDKQYLDELAGELMWYGTVESVTEPMKDEKGMWFVVVSYVDGTVMNQYVERMTPKELAEEIA